MQSSPPFHLAFRVHDLEAARRFYGDLLGCREGRSGDSWIDFDFYGHQLVAHLDSETRPGKVLNQVDGAEVPVPHFGVVLAMDEWRRLAERLEAEEVDFIIPPTLRFRDRPGEQATMFLADPSGNAIELKAMADPQALFAAQ
ncbi:MAG: VOC family protein [Sphingomonadaceae bacterium]